VTAPGLLFQGSDWDFATLGRIHDACEEIATRELGLTLYPTRIEVISAEQMLDAYASNGMPVFYRHWSFGKRFAHHESMYRGGFAGLAYEIVINSSPCLCYVMEENTATMQALVIAHAAFGHNHFFRNNQLFLEWTDAASILDYLEFARSYISQCEERHGEAAVERVLDAAHALSTHGVFRVPRRRMPDLASEERRERERRLHEEQVYNDLWRTLPGPRNAPAAKAEEAKRRALLQLPQENILYFLEKTAPLLRPWQREILRIVRHVEQYFYPQRQTKVMNEGCATFVHHEIMQRLHEQGRISDGHFLEFLHSHTNVVFQPNSATALLGHQSLCARLRDDGGHRPHCDTAGRGGPRVVPRTSPAGATPTASCARLGPAFATRASSPVSQPAPDAEAPAVSPGGRRRGARDRGRRDP
jgi:spore cortex formation protein SpoVR/YcgB (stage V sporulation)